MNGVGNALAGTAKRLGAAAARAPGRTSMPGPSFEALLSFKRVLMPSFPVDPRTASSGMS